MLGSRGILFSRPLAAKPMKLVGTPHVSLTFVLPPGTSAGGPARVFGPHYWAQPLKLFGRGSWQFPLTANLMQCHLQEPSNSLARDASTRWVRRGLAASGGCWWG